jgi:hypothetical protein
MDVVEEVSPVGQRVVAHAVLFSGKRVWIQDLGANGKAVVQDQSATPFQVDVKIIPLSKGTRGAGQKSEGA